MGKRKPTNTLASVPNYEPSASDPISQLPIEIFINILLYIDPITLLPLKIINNFWHLILTTQVKDDHSGKLHSFWNRYYEKWSDWLKSSRLINSLHQAATELQSNAQSVLKEYFSSEFRISNHLTLSYIHNQHTLSIDRSHFNTKNYFILTNKLNSILEEFKLSGKLEGERQKHFIELFVTTRHLEQILCVIGISWKLKNNLTRDFKYRLLLHLSPKSIMSIIKNIPNPMLGYYFSELQKKVAAHHNLSSWDLVYREKIITWICENKSTDFESIFISCSFYCLMEPKFLTYMSDPQLMRLLSRVTHQCYGPLFRNNHFIDRIYKLKSPQSELLKFLNSISESNKTLEYSIKSKIAFYFLSIRKIFYLFNQNNAIIVFLKIPDDPQLLKKLFANNILIEPDLAKDKAILNTIIENYPKSRALLVSNLFNQELITRFEALSYACEFEDVALLMLSKSFGFNWYYEELSYLDRKYSIWFKEVHRLINEQKQEIRKAKPIAISFFSQPPVLVTPSDQLRLSQMSYRFCK